MGVSSSEGFSNNMRQCISSKHINMYCESSSLPHTSERRVVYIANTNSQHRQRQNLASVSLLMQRLQILEQLLCTAARAQQLKTKNQKIKQGFPTYMEAFTIGAYLEKSAIRQKKQKTLGKKLRRDTSKVCSGRHRRQKKAPTLHHLNRKRCWCES